MPNFPKSSRTFLNGPSLYVNTPLFQKPKKSTESAHGQLSDAERDYQADLDAEKNRKVDPDAPGTPGTPGYEPPVKREDLDEEGKKIWDSHRKPK